jgi:ankyrin repeat protein
MFERVRELIEHDPALVHARGGDGKTALHSARTVEIARYLLEHGASIDARDVDHESTAAQYLAREAPGVARFLVDSGAWFDIFIAVALSDAALVERCLRDDPEALSHRTGHGEYLVGHDGSHPAPPERIKRGDIYRWVFDHNVTALDVAKSIGDENILNLLLARATPAQRLLAACNTADRAAAEGVIAANPEVVRRLTPEQTKLIAYKAYANEAAPVILMLDLGFDALAQGPEDWEPIRWAAFHGNAALVKRLLAHNPPIGVPDVRYDGTPLGLCIYGSLHGWSCRTGEFAATVRLLLDAGDRPRAADLPTGRDEVDAVLREYLAREARSQS